MAANTMKVNQFESRNYIKYKGRIADDVYEYNYVSPKSMNINEFQELLEANNISLTGGWLSFLKKALRLKTGQTYYKHTAKLVFSVD